MIGQGTPAAELAIDVKLVRALLLAQHPDLATLPLVLADTGWDNTTFRLGDTLALRMPRRALADALIEREQRWLPMVAARLPLPTPVPVRVGRPDASFPWHWSVVPWLHGRTADVAEPANDQAGVLAAFLRALHVPAPSDAPRSQVRGVALAERADVMAQRLARIAGRIDIDFDDLQRVWDAALAEPIDVEHTWIHGDPHARNVLVQDGCFSGVIDWGDMAAGDRATDLASIWMLFADPGTRRDAMNALPEISPATWARARGWAALFGVLLLESGLVDHPRHALMGERTLRRVLAGP